MVMHLWLGWIFNFQEIDPMSVSVHTNRLIAFRKKNYLLNVLLIDKHVQTHILYTHTSLQIAYVTRFSGFRCNATICLNQFSYEIRWLKRIWSKNEKRRKKQSTKLNIQNEFQMLFSCCFLSPLILFIISVLVLSYMHKYIIFFSLPDCDCHVINKLPFIIIFIENQVSLTMWNANEMNVIVNKYFLKINI